MLPVELRIFTKSQHTIQVLTGFQMLQKQGVISLTVKKEQRNDIPHPHFIEAVVDGTLIAFDTADGYENSEKLEQYLSNEDVKLYFKRSFSKEINQKLPLACAQKLRPLGLYYYTTYDGSVLGRGGETGLRRVLKLLAGKDMPMTVREFENRRWNTCHETPRILFVARLWDPGTAKTEEDRGERATINSLRVGVVRHLREKYPGQFFGGIQENDFAKSICPELMLPSNITKRRNYIRRMKNSDICITSMGLHASTGNRFAEFIAASRAVVCERMVYEAPGNLAEGINYLSFSSVEECVQSVEYLMQHRDKIVQMQQANHTYYLNFLRPDQMILNALKQL